MIEPYWQDGQGRVQFFLGDVRAVLNRLPKKSVQCVVTSPPYWGLRDYGTGKWEGGVEGCEHIERTPEMSHKSSTLGHTAAQRAAGTGRVLPASNAALPRTRRQYKDVCRKCGARRTDQQLGAEKIPDCLGWARGEGCGECYVCHILSVFRWVRRVLRDDGVVWLNLGDSYHSGKGEAGGPNARANGRNLDGKSPVGRSVGLRPNDRVIPGLTSGNLVGVPWRVALALQADGWVLRSDIVWAKPNPMPESVRSRCTKSHEYLFMLTKGMRYFYDADAIREPCVYDGPPKPGKQAQTAYTGLDVHHGHLGVGNPLGKNKRTVWNITPKPYKGAHFATFPPALVEPCVKAGSKQGDLVLDPFVGSGTTAEVCLRLGRRCWGIDLKQAYLDDHATKRVEKVLDEID